METIKFTILRLTSDMCMIKTSDCREVYRNIASSGCICDLEVMLDEMERITAQVRKMGNETVFVFTNTN